MLKQECARTFLLALASSELQKGAETKNEHMQLREYDGERYA